MKFGKLRTADIPGGEWVCTVPEFMWWSEIDNCEFMDEGVARGTGVSSDVTEEVPRAMEFTAESPGAIGGGEDMIDCPWKVKVETGDDPRDLS